MEDNMKKLLIILLCLFALNTKAQVLYPPDRPIASMSCFVPSGIVYAVSWTLFENKTPKRARMNATIISMASNLATTAVVYALAPGNSVNKRQDALTGFVSGCVTVCIVRIGLR